jgi:hypothetical protein
MRDWRTGLNPPPEDVLRELLRPRAGVRSPYETDGAINALVRSYLHLAERVAALERAAGTAASIPPAEQVAAQPELAEPEPERTKGVTSRVHELLVASPGRWWTTREIYEALLEGGQVHAALTLDQVSNICTLGARRAGRGWRSRWHPEQRNRRQYSTGAIGEGHA